MTEEADRPRSKTGVPYIEDEFRWFVFVHRADVLLWKFFHDVGICAFAILFFDAGCGSAEISLRIYSFAESFDQL